MTQDGGRHWEETKLDNLTLDRLMFIDKTTGWAVAHTENKAASGNQALTMKILRTQDSGKSWDDLWEKSVDSVSECGLWFKDTNCGYALVNGTLLSTRDGGKQWSTVSFGIDKFTPQHMSFVDADKGWVIGEIQQKSNPTSSDQNSETKLMVLQAANGGKHWRQQFKRAYPEGPVGSIGIGFVNANTGWFFTSDVNRKVGWVLTASKETGKVFVLKTLDGGRTWTQKDGDFLHLQVLSSGYFRFFDLQNGILATKDAVGTAFYRTQDGGETWQVSEQKSSKGIDQFSFISVKQGWRINSSGGANIVDLSRMTGGSTWQPLEQIGMDMRSYSIDFISENKGWILVEEPAYKSGSSRKLMITADGGRTWSSYVFPKGFDLETIRSQIPMQFTDDRHGWILTRYGLLKTDDGGKTWTWNDGQ